MHMNKLFFFNQFFQLASGPEVHFADTISLLKWIFFDPATGMLELAVARWVTKV
jgi:hypothetical protein